MSPLTPNYVHFRADLHCHSTFSDGTLTPHELLQLAKQNGLEGLSITDHDTFSAYDSALPFAQEIGIEMISGVEFSAVHKRTSVHVLGYSFALNNIALRTLCQQHENRRQERNEIIISFLAKQGFPLTMADVLAESKNVEGVIGRPHIALAMVRKGYVANIQETFNLYIGDGKSCFWRGKDFTVEETIAAIHNAHGFAILAHPHLFKIPKVIKDLLAMPFDGFEGYYANLPSYPLAEWFDLAKKKNLLITGGSDFHGEIKSSNALGSAWVDYSTFDILKKRFMESSHV